MIMLSNKMIKTKQKKNISNRQMDERKGGRTDDGEVVPKESSVDKNRCSEWESCLLYTDDESNTT